MRIGVPLQEPSGPDPMSGLREQVQRAADDGFASAWMCNIFGLDALTALAVAGQPGAGIELGTAVVPTYPRHPAALAQQALTVGAAVGAGRLVLGIGLSHKIVIEDMYGYSFDKPARHMREYLAVLLPLLERQPGQLRWQRRSARKSACPCPGRAGCRCCWPPSAPRMLELAGTAGRRHGAVDDRARHRPRLCGPGHHRAAAERRRGPPRGSSAPLPVCVTSDPDAARDQRRPALRDLRAAAVLPRHARPGRRRGPGRRGDRR